MFSFFKEDKIKELKFALVSFTVLIILMIFILIASLIFRGEAFNTACQAVQDNNIKLVTYLEETEHRAFKRIEAEEAEGKKPVSSKQEIEESINPLLTTLKPIDC